MLLAMRDRYVVSITRKQPLTVHRAALPFHEKFGYCLECNLNFCSACLARHQSVWFHKYHYITALPTGPDDKWTPQECQVCGDLHHGTYTCDEPECSWRTCHSCFFKLQRDNTVHPHLSLVRKELPHLHCISGAGKMCAPCKHGQTYYHCSSCKSGIMEGDLFYECVDCHRTFDQDGVSLCAPCFKVVSPFVANESHHWTSFRFRIGKEINENSCPLHCLDCNRTYVNWNRQVIARHAHRNWELTVGRVKAEELRRQQFKQCPLRSPGSPLDCTKETFDMDCSWCGKGESVAILP